MNKIFTNFIAIFGLTILISCAQGNQEKSGVDPTFPKESVEPMPTIYGIDHESVEIRKGPGTKFGKVINEKATKSLGETHYCQVDFSTKVEVLETKGSWSKIRVVDPQWLSASHVGWIPSKVIISPEDQEKQSIGELDKESYEILETEHNRAVQNFHVLLKRAKFDKNYVYQFIKAFRKENCTMNCNVNLYDSKSVSNLIGVYPLEGKDYLKMADHLISASSFDATEVRDWYPYQDFKYKEFGGRNWKKKPVK
ncbi:SH3 domain-containing protein [Pedobacter sp. KBW06]|uniref:SH3 domain-containing protein n=1 Tax=Pedobacter sp. KBW06 TaxID=2153359 RepID=UPI000F5AAE85|nr:SH3 domain-containing protein [Pedobacter sp. KBW06]